MTGSEDLGWLGQHRTLRVKVVDGVAGAYKVCKVCKREKRVAPRNKDSEFHVTIHKPSGRAKNTSISFSAKCKKCNLGEQREMRANDPDWPKRMKAWRDDHSRRIREDPELLAQERDRHAQNNRARIARMTTEEYEEYVEHRRQVMIEWRAKNPGYYTQTAIRARREARAERERRADRERDARRPSVPARQCALWLEAYAEAKGIISDDPRRPELIGDRLARELGVNARRVTSVLSGESKRVSLDVVDLALANATEVVAITWRGKTIDVWSISDLYSDRTLKAATRRAESYTPVDGLASASTATVPEGQQGVGDAGRQRGSDAVGGVGGGPGHDSRRGGLHAVGVRVDAGGEGPGGEGLERVVDDHRGSAAGAGGVDRRTARKAA